MSSVKVVTSRQMRLIEERAEQAGTSTDTLMERAGEEVALRVESLQDDASVVAVLVGPGSNGGDGLVAARRLCGRGRRVEAYICTPRRTPDPKLQMATQEAVRVIRANEDRDMAQLRDLLDRSHVVVDAILGTGRSRPIEGDLEAILGSLDDARGRLPEMRLVAVDVPTGLDADTGAADPACVAADLTVSLGFHKAGLLTPSGADVAGEVTVADIGLNEDLANDVDVKLMTTGCVGKLLPSRPLAAHKGTFGRALVVAGSRRYVGAAHLAAMGAYRAGAGLVTLAVPESLCGPLATAAPEPTYLPLPETGPGIVSPDAAPLLLQAVAGYDALLIGCGLGVSTASRRLVEAVLYSDRDMPPTVVDADGLNILSLTRSNDMPWWRLFPRPAVLTPHPGEMARLRVDTPTEPGGRIDTARESADRWNKVTVLKGAHTVVASPGGGVMVSPFANPGLATAGTGDVLAGVISGLLAQGLSLAHAASLGVYLHGAAGESVRRELGDSGIVASDLLPEVPRAAQALRQG